MKFYIRIKQFIKKNNLGLKKISIFVISCNNILVVRTKKAKICDAMKRTNGYRSRIFLDCATEPSVQEKVIFTKERKRGSTIKLYFHKPIWIRITKWTPEDNRTRRMRTNPMDTWRIIMEILISRYFNLLKFYVP